MAPLEERRWHLYYLKLQWSQILEIDLSGPVLSLAFYNFRDVESEKHICLGHTANSRNKFLCADGPAPKAPVLLTIVLQLMLSIWKPRDTGETQEHSIMLKVSSHTQHFTMQQGSILSDTSADTRIICSLANI